VGNYFELCLYYTTIKMKRTETNIELIVKLLTGDASVEEKQNILEWAKENYSNKKLYIQLKDIWESTNYERDKHFDLQSGWNQFKNQIAEKVDISKRQEKKQLYLNILKVAALVIITFGISWIAFSYKNETKLAVTTNEINVPLGSKTQVTLPDGSKVWVNSGSNLKYNSDFNDTCRIVYLSGEAYFEVEKNPEKPFVVKTGSIDIKAFGTSFNVKSYPEDNFIETILVSGIVTVENEKTKKQIANLTPNQKTIYYKEDAKIAFENKVKTQEKSPGVEKIVTINPKAQMVMLETKPENFTAWKDQKLIFSSEPFEQIAIKLERWYGVNIEILDDRLKNERFTGKFTHNESLVQLLEAIKITTHINYKVKLNDVFISLDK